MDTIQDPSVEVQPVAVDVEAPAAVETQLPTTIEEAEARKAASAPMHELVQLQDGSIVTRQDVDTERAAGHEIH